MSKNIVCVCAEPAGRMPLTLSSSQTICTALIRRMKDKLETKNPYLLIYISEAIYRLEFWNLQFGVFRNDTKNLSKNIVYALQADSTHMLDSIRPLESVLRPLEKEWTTIPRDVETQCKFVCDALFLIAEDMYVLREVVALSCISRTKHQTVNLEIIRKHVINMRAVQGRTYALQEDSKKSLSSTQIMEKSEMKPNKSLVHVLIPVLNIVGPGTTDRDIATLILRWTTLDEFNGFTRVSSHQEPEDVKTPQTYVEEKSENGGSDTGKVKGGVKFRHGLWRLW